MAVFTKGVVPWNSLDDNTRLPLTSELEGGYPCGQADQQLFNFTAGYSWGQVHNAIIDSGITPDLTDLTQLSSAIRMAAGRLIAVRTFTSSGMYTPTPGMTFCIVEGCGGGGGGAGGANPGVGQVSLGAPGGSATSGRARFTSSDIGSGKAVTIGSAGTGGSALPPSPGGNGGSTTLDGLLVLPGGLGGQMFNSASSPSFNGNGGISAPATGANISSLQGSTPGYATALTSNNTGLFCGPGGSSPYGTGRANDPNSNGISASGYGAGGSGVALTNGGGPASGGDGSPGLLIIIEYGI